MGLLRTFLFMPLLTLALIMISSIVSAQEVPPRDWNDKIESTFDLSALPAKIFIWNKKLAARDAEPTMRGGTAKWAKNVFLCHSDTDDKYGACETSTGSGKSSRIKLRFEELRSGMSRSLELEAIKAPYSSTDINSKALNNSGNPADSPQTLLHVYFAKSALSELPAGGIWKGHLKLRQMHERTQVAVNEAEITLNVTDTKNVQIYLPEHNTTTPIVDLGLIRQVGHGGRTSGRRSIDMCLYDGFGANSSWFDVTVKDDLEASPRAPGSFSVVRKGTSGDFYNRIDYGVTYRHRGQEISIKNGTTVRLEGGGDTEIRQVSLPAIKVPVLCKPMPLTLVTPEFNALHKRAGDYEAKLRIIFSPSTQSM